MKSNTKKMQGFTLIEVMIAVAVVAILVGLAVPSYQDHIERSRRSDAKVVLLRLAQMQESYFVQNLSYAQDLTTGAGGLGLTVVPVPSENNYYNVTIAKIPPACNGTAANSCTGFVLTATTANLQVNDTHCNAYMITETGRKSVSGFQTAAGDRDAECWRR